jgi:hypothetical protein
VFFLPVLVFALQAIGIWFMPETVVPAAGMALTFAGLFHRRRGHGRGLRRRFQWLAAASSAWRGPNSAVN